MPLTQQIVSQSYSSYGIFILETLIALALMAVAAWALVRFGRNRFAGTGKKARMKIVERLVLEPKRSVYLVEIDGAEFLIGVSEGSVQLLKKIRGARTDGDAPGESSTQSEGRSN